MEQTQQVPEVVKEVVEKINDSINEQASVVINKITGKKTAIYLIILVIVLGGIGYYLYKKHFNKPEEPKKEDKPVIKKEDDSGKKQILNPSNEYYILDPNGNPILISTYFNDIVKLHLTKQQMMQAPVMVQIPMQAQEKTPDTDKNQRQEIKQRPKLTHPDESDENESSEQEDDNIADQNLTNEEIEALKKELEIMERKQKAQVMAQNDEDDD